MVDSIKTVREPLNGWWIVVAAVIIGVALIVGVLISRTNANMCSVNWGPLGTWVEAFAIIVTAVYAAIQFAAYRGTERVKNTLELLRSREHLKAVNDANRVITGVGVTQGDFDEDEVARSSILRLRSGIAPMNSITFLRVERLESYLYSIASLYERRLIDRKLYIWNASTLILQGWTLVQNAFQTSPQSPHYRALGSMAMDAYKFDSANPDSDRTALKLFEERKPTLAASISVPRLGL